MSFLLVKHLSNSNFIGKVCHEKLMDIYATEVYFIMSRNFMVFITILFMIMTPTFQLIMRIQFPLNVKSSSRKVCVRNSLSSQMCFFCSHLRIWFFSLRIPGLLAPKKVFVIWWCTTYDISVPQCDNCILVQCVMHLQQQSDFVSQYYRITQHNYHINEYVTVT